MAFDGTAWTVMIVQFSLPWVALLLATRQAPSPSDWYDALRKPRWGAPGRAWLRTIAAFACSALGLGAFLVVHVDGGAGVAALQVAMIFYLLHLGFASLWIVCFFEHRNLWDSLLASVTAACAATGALVGGALCTAWSLFGWLPYVLGFWVLTASTLVTYRDNAPKPSPSGTDSENSKTSMSAALDDA